MLHRARRLTATYRAALLAGAACAPCLLAPPAAAQTSPAEPSATLPPVTVTATPIEGGGTYVPVTILRRAEIATRPVQSLGDTLFNEPGLSATTFAPGASRPIIRGLDGFRVRLQENGFGANDVSAYGEDHPVPFDPLTADSIEVIRGPAALRWGSQAIGGVVSVLNNRIPTERLPEGTARVRASGGWNSISRGFDGTGSVDAGIGNFVVHGDVLGRVAHDYGIPGGGRQANSFVRSNGQAVGLSYFFEQGFVGSSISRFASRYGIPGGESAALQTAIDMEQIRWAARGEYRPTAGPVRSVNFWLGYTQYQHNEIGLEDPGEAEADGEAPAGRHVHGGFRNRSWDGRLEAQHVPIATSIGALNGTLGFSFEQERLRTTLEAADFLPPANTSRFAGYIFEELGITDATRLQAAFRIESVTIDGATALFPQGFLPVEPDQTLTNADRRRSFTPFSISLGLLHDLPWGMTARLTGQYVQRAPSAAELFSRGSHHASGTFDIGNPNLGIEAARTVELGISRSAGSFRFDANAYYASFDGFIFRALTGNSCGVSFASCMPGEGGEFRQVVYGQRDARFYGGEFTAQLDLFRIAEGTFGISGRYDFVRAEFEQGGGNVPRIPPHRLGGGIWWRNARWQANLDYLHAFDQNDTAAFETRTPGYDLLNARLAYTARLPGPPAGAITFTVIGSNLLDADMRNSASFKKDEVLLPGRSIRLLATMVF